MEFDGEYGSTRDSQAALVPGIVPAIAIMLTIIVVLFNAYRPPLIIVLIIPFAVVGITIGLLAYKLSLEGEEPPVIDGFTGMQRVFLGFGQVWRGIIRDEELRQRIATDPHSPAVYRTNGPVRNVPEWYVAFDVQPDDELYLPPEERVKIW